MPEWCVKIRCVECESHAIVNGKLDCNYENRLGLQTTSVKSFMDSADTPEKVEAKIKEIESQTKKLEEDLKTLSVIRGGKKNE